MYVYVSSSHAESDDAIELTHTVKVPIHTMEQWRNGSRYKYLVISSANEVMKSPFEFITGHTAHGGIINRSLTLPHNKFEEGSKQNSNKSYYNYV